MSRLQGRSWGTLLVLEGPFIGVPVVQWVFVAERTRQGDAAQLCIACVAAFAAVSSARKFLVDLSDEGIRLPWARLIRWDEVTEARARGGRFTLRAGSQTIVLPLWPFRDRAAVTGLIRDRLRAAGRNVVLS